MSSVDRVQSSDLVQYLGEFGLALSDLLPHQVAMFLAGKRAARYLEELEIPIHSARWDASDLDLVELQDESVLDVTAFDDAALDSYLPADEMDVRLIRSTEDLPRIFPLEWLWELLLPDLFYAKLAQQELLMPEWQRGEQGPGNQSDEAPRRELEEESAGAEAMKLHAYVLLDTSTTMQDHDRRGTIARGLALEFLRESYRRGAHLLLRPFTAEVGELSVGYSQADFFAMTRRLIALPNSGQTRIQTALEQAVKDIRSGGPCLGASILLITDGISRLSENPLAGEWLHTVILGDLYDERRAAGAIATLKQWSHTFHRIWQSHFPAILAPSPSDCQAGVVYLQGLVDQIGRDPSGHAGLRQALENVKTLLDQFRRSLGRGGSLPLEMQKLQEQLARMEYTLGFESKQESVSLPPQPPIAANRRFFRAKVGRTSKGSVGDNADLWSYLRLMAVRAWRWLRRHLPD